MEEIRNQFRKIATLISAQADVAGGTGHAATTGKLRELIIQQFLRPHLPKTLEIKSGIIIDSEGNRSKQQDCVIVDSRLPMIDIGSDTEGILIAESVVATIEIKSFLNKADLLTTLKSCARTKALKRNGEQEYKKGAVEMRFPNPLPINTYIFAYDGIGLSTITDHMKKYSEKKNDGTVIPEASCIMTKGVLQRTSRIPTVVPTAAGHHVNLPPIKKIELTTQSFSKDSLFAFYRRLLIDVLPLRMRIYDIDSYYASEELE